MVSVVFEQVSLGECAALRLSSHFLGQKEREVRVCQCEDSWQVTDPYIVICGWLIMMLDDWLLLQLGFSLV